MRDAGPRHKQRGRVPRPAGGSAGRAGSGRAQAARHGRLHAGREPGKSLLWRPWLQCAACSLLLTGGTAAGLQVTGRWQVHHPGLQPLHSQAMELKRSFEEFSISHMPRCACAAHVLPRDKHSQAARQQAAAGQSACDHQGRGRREANKVADALSNVAMDGDGWEGLRDPQAPPTDQSLRCMLHLPCI